ncbi:RNA-binding domain-containing protein [Wolfiporia cocos MD-104 SS10]|uniref:RNA-binding domain-containing protein n=1 Tax=Wolfiporia cocos (strain MD-104) TaxID=742152 RepID=A0A2H3J296_WOLCO|nr:RNA-binding domain-containing protein [Wolfiporia cocos MD-104 SS10]
MSDGQRLTKKQKKALAFRERKGKGKAKAFDEDNAVPVPESQDMVEAEMEGSHGGQSAKKRKREEDKPVAEDKSKPKKKRKGVEGNDVSTEEEGDAKAKPVGKETKQSVKQRYILFVGNLKYTTTKEAIQEHFSKCDPPPSVRLMTPKPIPGKSTTKSKGFAFLEFTSRNALQQALKLHQSELEGRMINIELTAGGGGKSESRLEKLKKRNRELYEQRQKRLEKQKKGAKDDAGASDQFAKPQRYSATSGIGQAPSKKRTWSIAEPTDGESKLGKKGKKRPPKALGTGVNAIPVG